MFKDIVIHICTKDRATEVALLLESLRHQTFQNFNILILDDGSSVPLFNYYFIQYLIQRLRIEGHDIKIIRNNLPSGVSKARQQLVDYTMQKGKEKYICRIDDDSICKEDFLEKLLEGIHSGYDLVGSIVSPFANPDIKREIKFVEPVIGYCELDNKGNLKYMGDDCGYQYTEEKIIPTCHFRSSCLYKRELHENGVDYTNRLSKHGFLEEAIFSFKAILKGFKLAIHTGAINWHLMTPSGGERDTSNMIEFNIEIFKKTVNKMFFDNGNFISKYIKKLNINKNKIKIDYNKQTNLCKGWYNERV